ncbi:esterase [Rhizobium leguminosarum]|uniref:esterase n=1 Tax=Rhizobium leguminosarum TaxID=384 RepID=UPI003ECF253A
MFDLMFGSSLRIGQRAIFLACIVFALMHVFASAHEVTDQAVPPLVIERQGSFFVGGRDVRSDKLSPFPDDIRPDTITVDQIYVHYQIPAFSRHRYSLVLVHGCCLTGKTWETTPDGRMGWDEYFVRKGYPTYVVDQADRGKSATNPAAINSVKGGETPVTQLPSVFSVGHEVAWVNFRFGPEYTKVFPGMQFPLEAQAEFWKQMVPDWSFSLENPNPTVPALSELAVRLGSAVLVAHSQAGAYAFQAATLNAQGIAAIVAIEPTACPSKVDIPQSLKKMPILILFGDYIDFSPRWSPRLTACQQFAAAINSLGGRALVVRLPDVGIHGNSHMMMQDHNNKDVADWLLNWIGDI